MKAFAWRTGRIDFGEQVPDGALLIVSDEKSVLRDAIGKTARLAYDGKTLLVPGVIDETNGIAAVDALIEYRKQVMKLLDGGRHEHVSASPR